MSVLTIVIGAVIAIIANHRCENTARSRVATVIGAGVTVIADNRNIKTAGIDVAVAICAGIAIIAIDGRAEATYDRVAIIIGAGIAIIAVNGRVDARFVKTQIIGANIIVAAIERVAGVETSRNRDEITYSADAGIFSANITVIAVNFSENALPAHAFIRSAIIAIIANNGR